MVQRFMHRICGNGDGEFEAEGGYLRGEEVECRVRG